MKAPFSGKLRLYLPLIISAAPGLFLAQSNASSAIPIKAAGAQVLYSSIQTRSFGAAQARANHQEEQASMTAVRPDGQAQVFVLECMEPGFNGYFHPNRWVDPAVNSTGSEEGLWLHTSREESIKVINRQITQVQMLIPANGYLSFAWDSPAKAASDAAPFAVYVNGNPIPITPSTRLTRTPYIQAGDILSFEWLPGQEDVQAHIMDFRFLTSAAQIEEYTWSSVSGRVFRELIVHEQADISAIRFPATPDKPVKNRHPDQTGYPYLEADAQDAAAEKQIILAHVAPGVHISWRDEPAVSSEGQYGLLRTWTIVQPCRGNIVEGKQFIPLEDSLESRPSWSFD